MQRSVPAKQTCRCLSAKQLVPEPWRREQEANIIPYCSLHRLQSTEQQLSQHVGQSAVQLQHILKFYGTRFELLDRIQEDLLYTMHALRCCLLPALLLYLTRGGESLRCCAAEECKVWLTHKLHLLKTKQNVVLYKGIHSRGLNGSH